jgi:hypothetical protein
MGGSKWEADFFGTDLKIFKITPPAALVANDFLKLKEGERC